MKTVITTLFLCITALLHGAEPSVTLYQIIEEDVNKGITGGELILKLNNPTDRTFFVFGNSITDIPHNIEVFRNEKWEVIPPRRCGFGMSMRKFLPQSSIVFDAHEAPLHEDDLKFRVRVWIYTDDDHFNLYKDPNRKAYVELLSPEFSTKDFHKNRTYSCMPPRLPGTPLDKPPEAPAGEVPKIPAFEPIPK